MNILFNDLARHRERSGVGGYVEELTALFSSAESIRLLSDTRLGNPIARLMTRSLGSATSSSLKRSRPVLRKMGHDLLSGYLRTMGLGRFRMLYHEPDLIPLFRAEKTVVTVHDLSVLRHPSWHPDHRRKHYEKRLTRIYQAERFMADSTQTATDLHDLLGVPRDKIDLVHLAPRSAVVRAIDSVNGNEDRTLPKRFILYAGTLEPRKNIAGLLNAYRSLPAPTRREFPLVLIGGTGWNSAPLIEMLSGASSEGIRYLGYLPDDQYAQYLARASLFVYPSFFEGFGLPPLEAMAAGVPVVASQSGSLSEILEEATEPIDPYNVESIANGMLRVLEDPAHSKSLRELGTLQVAKYSWEKTFAGVRECYAKCMGN